MYSPPAHAIGVTHVNVSQQDPSLHRTVLLMLNIDVKVYYALHGGASEARAALNGHPIRWKGGVITGHVNAALVREFARRKAQGESLQGLASCHCLMKRNVVATSQQLLLNWLNRGRELGRGYRAFPRHRI